MNNMKDLPLLLLDNSSMMSVLNEGEFKCQNLTFEEAKHLLDIHNEEDILRCFSNADILALNDVILNISIFVICAPVRMQLCLNCM